MDESKEEMPSTYDVYYKAHDATISKWFAAERLSTHCGDDTQNEKGLKQCSAVHRIAIVMACATHDMQRTFETFFQKESADTDRIYSVTAFMDDYHHIIKDHDDELENLRYFLIDEYDSECSQQCDYLTRNYRNKSEWSNDREMELYHTNDNKVVLINRQIDKIHAYLFHSFELNYRLTEKEALQIFGTKTEQKDDKKYDDEEEEDMDHEGQQKTQQIGQMMKVIECKRTKMRVLVGDARMTNNKFVTNVVSDQKTDPASTDEHSDEKEQRKEVSATEYSFGFPFKYYTRFKHGKWFICKKHSDMKDELLNNPFQTLSLAQYQHQYEESNVFLECAAIRRLKCEHIPLYDEPQAIDTGLSPKSPITAPHIMSLLFYCNFTELCTVFSSTFRRIAQNETDEGVKERNAHFFHWSKLLLESIHLFGTPLTTGGILSKFTVYHGVSCIMVFNNMNQGVYGPFSTTAQFNVALQFADSGKTGGLVLTLGRSSSIKHNKYFDCGLISNFTAESEKLFLNGLVQIHDIVHVKSKQSFGWYCRALTVLTSMLNATPLNSRIARKIHAKFYAAMMDGGAKYPKYAQALWKHTVNSIKSVDIDLQLMNVIEADTAEENIKQFLVKHTQSLTKMKECKKWGFKLLNSFVMLPNGWINLERLCQLLPNLEVVRIERYKRGNLDITNDKLVESITLNEELIDRFLEYQPQVPISIIIMKPDESQMSLSSFVSKCREMQKGQMNKAFAVETGTTNSDTDLKCVFVCFGDTPLHQACTNGEDELVSQLLKSDDEAVQSSINQPARYTKATPLFIACDQGHIKCVEHMLSIDTVSINTLDRYKNNALQITVSNGANDIAMMLLAHSDKMQEKGIQHGILDINHVQDEGNSVLHCAVLNNNHQIIEALIKRGINTDLQNAKHETALHVACEKQHIEIVEILLKHEANPNIPNVHGRTCLMESIFDGYTKGIELLLKYKADVHIINEHDKNNRDATAMYYAIKKNSKNIISMLLDAGFDPTSIGTTGQTVLHVAAEEAQSETLKTLFETATKTLTKDELKAFVNQTNEDGDTALCVASADDDREDCAEYLIHNTECDVNILNKEGRSALSIAVSHNNEKVSKMLLTAGATIDIIDISGRSLLFYAAAHGNVALLKEIHDTYLNKNRGVEKDQTESLTEEQLAKQKLVHAFRGVLGKYAADDIDKAPNDNNDANGSTPKSESESNRDDQGGDDEVKDYILTVKQVFGEQKPNENHSEEWNAFVNLRDDEGKTALHAACTADIRGGGDVKCVQYLIKVGAKIDVYDHNGCSVFHTIARAEHGWSDGCAVMEAIHMELFKKSISGAHLNHDMYDSIKQLVNHADKNHETALFAAACDPKMAKYILSMGGEIDPLCDLNSTAHDQYKATALSNAARSACLELVQRLLDAGAKINTRNYRKQTPLHKAAGCGNCDVLKAIYYHYLQTTDADTTKKFVNQKNVWNKTALFTAVEWDNNIEAVEFLLSIGADVNTFSDSGWSVLIEASNEGKLPELKAIYNHYLQSTNLTAATRLVNHKDEDKKSALTHAAEGGYFECLEFLLSVGAELNISSKDKEGNSILHLATQGESIKCAKAICEHILQTKNEKEAKEFVNSRNQKGQTALLVAAQFGNKDMIAFLHSVGADINVFEWVKGQSALHELACSADIRMAPMIYQLYLKDTNLSEATKFINAQDFNKDTMLHIACDSNRNKDDRTQHVKWFLDNAMCDVNLRNMKSETPLLIAAKKGYTDILKMLLEKDVHLVDEDGNCEALRLAKQKKKECADAIEECLMGKLSADEATQIIEKYPENYPDEDESDDGCIVM
eukprot:116721_1